jgi:hypothetical protein
VHAPSINGFVDGCRSLLLAGAFLGLSGLRFGDRKYQHDAWISFRRFYLPEELGLLCGLGPLGEGVTARHLAPGHCLVSRLAHESPGLP